MRKAPRIGIIGLAGAGKDTLADIIRSEFPELGLHRERFASPLKKAARFVFGPDFDERDYKEVERFISPSLEDRIITACIQLGHDLRLADDELEVFQGAVFEQFWVVGASLSPRKFQQRLGTECVRRARETAFVDRIAGAPGAIIVPDCRFGNETLVFNHLLLVVRPGVDPVSEHPSEALAKTLTQFVLERNAETFGPRISGFEYTGTPVSVVYNDGSIETLRSEVKGLKGVL